MIEKRLHENRIDSKVGFRVVKVANHYKTLTSKSHETSIVQITSGLTSIKRYVIGKMYLC
jgi:hypothetical protein